MTDNRTRTLTIDRAHAKARDTFPVTLSTETPYLREFGYEILDHSRVDLSRAPLPLIESHNVSQLNIGIVDGLHVEGEKLRGLIRLGKSARAKELAEDIREGIVRNVSIGYQVSDGERIGEKDGEPVYRFAFFPHELSLVAAGADINAGIYRSNTMETQENTTRSERKNQSNQIELERHRASEILVIGKQFGYLDLAQKGVDDGESVADFREKIIQKMNRDQEKNPIIDCGTRSHSQNFAGMPCDNTSFGRAMGNYSIIRLLRGMAEPKELQYAGLELEISQDMQRTRGKKTRGVMVPWEALSTRATTAGGSAGNLISTELMPGRFIDVLRNKSHVMQLNPTILTGLEGNVAIPRKTATSTAYWIAGDGGDSVTESDTTLDQVTLSPNTVGGATTFSHKLMIQSSMDVEQYIRNDLAAMIAVEIDLKAIAGDGTGNTPVGLVNQSGINVTTFAAASPTWAELVAMEATISADNADVSGMAYLTTPALVAHCKTAEKFTSTGQTIWADGREHGQGVVNGYRCLSSGNVPTGNVILADWSQLLVGFWGGVELDADPYGSNFLKGSITVRVLADVDIAVRQPVSFCVSSA